MSPLNFETYDPEDYYDELFESSGVVRPGAKLLVDKINTLDDGELHRRQEAAEASLFGIGATFNVYGNDQGEERILPFDMVPRIIESSEWDTIERGLKQRIQALNLFIDDLYHEQKILKDNVVPRELIYSGKTFRPECVGLNPPRGIWCHITGTDLVRHRDGTWYVLEDNMRCPSGVSYVLENREVLKRTFPQVFEDCGVRPVFEYPNKLVEMLQSVAPITGNRPCVGVLTPGSYNSAYFEHSYLAQQMGAMLVEGRDLVVQDGFLNVRTVHGFRRIDVLYRRIDDDFLDPKVFRPDSMLGVPGLMEAYRAGNVALANAPGTGIADDKAVYAYVPLIVKYYLDQDMILPNVPTYLCHDPKQCEYVLANIENLVVKAANESGGYGMIIGPHASAEECARFKEYVKANPRNYIAQPMLSLSRVPTLIDDHFEGRHVDLRPFILYGDDIYVLPGGLTRVALRKGSMVVNSSQGGGSKDTWVVQV